MKLRIRYITLLLSILLIGCKAGSITNISISPTATSDAILMDDKENVVTSTSLSPFATPNSLEMEYTIFTDLLPQLYGNQSVYVIDENSRSYGIPIEISKELPTISPETLKNYKVANAENYSLTAIFSEDNKFAMVNRDEYLRPMMCPEAKCADLEKLQKKYPGASGVIMLSKIGFNRAKNQALVYTQIDIGTSENEFHIVLLNMQDGEWVIEDSIKVEWVS